MHIPFIATVDLLALPRPAPEPGLVLTGRDDHGTVVARSVVTLADAEAYAHAILATVAAARLTADTPATRIGDAPRTSVQLMQPLGGAPRAAARMGRLVSGLDLLAVVGAA